ncbi:hypothetical protein JHK84_028158 [Glycine max]|nr:hypothetical protein JHK84_028158 [Glycine max]
MEGPFSTGSLKLNLNHPRSLSFSGSMEATQNFTNALGEGSFGTFYKAMMPTGEVVAMKMLGPNSKQGEKEFQTEAVPPVVHRDLKSANILLDHSMRAKGRNKRITATKLEEGKSKPTAAAKQYEGCEAQSSNNRSLKNQGKLPNKKRDITKHAQPPKKRDASLVAKLEEEGPKTMHFVRDSIPATAIETGGVAPTQTVGAIIVEDHDWPDWYITSQIQTLKSHHSAPLQGC